MSQPTSTSHGPRPRRWTVPYGDGNGDDEHNNRYMSMPVPVPPSARPQHGTLPDYSNAGLPAPATAYVLVQQDGNKRSSMTRRLMKAFTEATVDPERTALGFVPGQPTPHHILEKEEEEIAAEEEKHEQESKRKEELIRQSKMRRASAVDAYRRERFTQEPRKQAQVRARSQSLQNPPRQMRLTPNYNAHIAGESTRGIARPRGLDSTQDYGRLSTQPSKYVRQQFDEQQKEPRERSKQKEQQRPRRGDRPRSYSQSLLRPQSEEAYDYEHEFLAEYGLTRDFPNSPSLPP